jgi:hypothetical protein
MFYCYEKDGQFFTRPHQVGQSELYLHFLYWLSKVTADAGSDGIYLAIGIFEAISVAI